MRQILLTVVYAIHIFTYIGKNGNDANPGSIDKPFKTMTFARDYIRQLKNESKFPVGGVEVNIRSGSYDFMSAPFSLTADDSGEPDSPIMWVMMHCYDR